MYVCGLFVCVVLSLYVSARRHVEAWAAAWGLKALGLSSVVKGGESVLLSLLV